MWLAVPHQIIRLSSSRSFDLLSHQFISESERNVHGFSGAKVLFHEESGHPYAKLIGVKAFLVKIQPERVNAQPEFLIIWNRLSYRPEVSPSCPTGAEFRHIP